MAHSICTIVGVGEKVGAAVAEAFGKEGFELALIARNRDHLTDIAGRLESEGVTVRTYAADATDEKALKSCFDSIEQEAGVPEVVVYNPAIIAEEKPSELTPEGLQPYFDVMLYGALNTVNAALPRMRQRSSGTLLFTGGGFAIEPAVELSSHSIAKAALRNYVRALYKELEQEGLHAATVTITRPLEAGEDMQTAAAQFVKLYRQQLAEYDWEIVYGD